MRNSSKKEKDTKKEETNTKYLKNNKQTKSSSTRTKLENYKINWIKKNIKLNKVSQAYKKK